MITPATREDLISALARSDEASRIVRAERIDWLAQHYSSPGVVMGELAIGHMLEEARQCFISGHFIGSMLLASSFVEQTLSEELECVVPAPERRTFELLIKAGRQHLRLPADLFDRTDKLRQLRNPFTHRKSANHPDSFGMRFMLANLHPLKILEADGKLAMEVMYEWFRYTIRAA